MLHQLFYQTDCQGNARRDYTSITAAVSSSVTGCRSKRPDEGRHVAALHAVWMLAPADMRVCVWYRRMPCREKNS